MYRDKHLSENIGKEKHIYQNIKAPENISTYQRTQVLRKISTKVPGNISTSRSELGEKVSREFQEV